MGTPSCKGIMLWTSGSTLAPRAYVPWHQGLTYPIVTCQKFCSVCRGNLVLHFFSSRSRDGISIFIIPPLLFRLGFSTEFLAGLHLIPSTWGFTLHEMPPCKVGASWVAPVQEKLFYIFPPYQQKILIHMSLHINPCHIGHWSLHQITPCCKAITVY